MSENLFSFDFEVYGKVQGVFFRKYTEEQALKLGLRGWCMNTEEGSVKGYLEGPESELNEMTHWIQNKGSPRCHVDMAIFSETRPIENYSCETFSIKR